MSRPLTEARWKPLGLFEILRFCIREMSVVRGRPSRAAAPLRPQYRGLDKCAAIRHEDKAVQIAIADNLDPVQDMGIACVTSLPGL